MANDDWRRVFNGYLSLDSDERRRFRRELRKYEDGSYTERKEIRENIRIALGPLEEVCPGCGK